MTTQRVSLTVNGRPETIDIQTTWTLVQVLREGLFLRGTEEGCGEGSCGSCTVLVDGKLVRACLYLGVRADGSTVETVEGLADGDVLHPVQEAFVTCGGIQCGFCTPGFLISTRQLLNENPDPTEDEIKEFLSGNFCRCGGYSLIIDAVKSAAVALRSDSS